MNGIDENAAGLLRLTDDLRLIHYEAMRERAEQKRDLAQLEMDACDKRILEINKSKMSNGADEKII